MKIEKETIRLTATLNDKEAEIAERNTLDFLDKFENKVMCIPGILEHSADYFPEIQLVVEYHGCTRILNNFKKAVTAIINDMNGPGNYLRQS